MSDSMAIKEFYFLLKAAIKGAKAGGHLKLLMNKQTLPAS
jgi:hypothetical protein